MSEGVPWAPPPESFPRTDGYPAPGGAWPPPAPPPPRPRTVRGRPARPGARLAILLFAALAVVGLVMVGISDVMVADAEQNLHAAENECEYAYNATYCDGDRGQDIEDQADAAEANTTVTADTLSSWGVTLAFAGGGVATILLLVRRMDRIEAGHNPPE